MFLKETHCFSPSTRIGADSSISGRFAKYSAKCREVFVSKVVPSNKNTRSSVSHRAFAAGTSVPIRNPADDLARSALPPLHTRKRNTAVRTAAHVGEARKINSCLSQLLIDRRALGSYGRMESQIFSCHSLGTGGYCQKPRVGMPHRLGGHDQGTLWPKGTQKRLDDRLRTSDQIAERPERSVQHDGISPLQPQLSE